MEQSIIESITMVVWLFLKSSRRFNKLRDLLGKFQHIVDKSAVNQHLPFTVVICTHDTNLSPSENKDVVQLCAAGGFPFRYINMSCSPKGDLQFGISLKRGQKLNYVVKVSIHTPGNLCVIPLGFLNRLMKLTLCKLTCHSKRVYYVYPDHDNHLCEAGLAPLSFITIV